jgi:RNA polymerase sigma-70 factor (sigma-E family)
VGVPVEDHEHRINALVSEPEDFEAFYRRRFGPMVRFATLIVGDAHDAAEIAQNAFVGLYPRFERLRDGNPDAYLQRATLNGCRRFLRRQKLARTRTPPGNAGATTDDVDHVLDAIRQLGAKHRDVVMLRFYLDLSEAEIARVLKIPPGTVKSRLHRALEQLREALA